MTGDRLGRGHRALSRLGLAILSACSISIGFRFDDRKPVRLPIRADNSGSTDRSEG
jgi:hypothetical protein